MPGGRPAKPTKLKALSGNPGKREIQQGLDVPAGRPACPKHLQGEARKEWNRTVRQLMQYELISKLDRAALAAYCQAWANWVDAHEHLAMESMITVTDKGYPVLNPWWNVATTSVKQMKAFLTEFGMSPASRTKVAGADSGNRPATVNDILDEILDRGG